MRSLFFICLMLVTSGRAQDGPQVKLYGFVLVNARYNTDSPADVPSIVATTDTVSNFLITARQSRLGMHTTRTDWQR